MSEREGLSLLIAVLTEQTGAINRLAQSNEALVQVMIDSEGIDATDLGREAYLKVVGK